MREMWVRPRRGSECIPEPILQSCGASSKDTSETPQQDWFLLEGFRAGAYSPCCSISGSIKYYGTSNYISVNDFARKHEMSVARLYRQLNWLRATRKLEIKSARQNRKLYLTADLQDAMRLTEQPKDVNNDLPDFAGVDGEEVITATEFGERHNLNPHSVRTIASQYGVAPVKTTGRNAAKCYRAADIIKALRASRDRRDGKLDVEQFRGLARSKKWVKHNKGDKLRVTNVAGKSWVGFFAGYKGTELARLKLSEGEVVFACDAIIEAVDDSVPVSLNDGFGDKFRRYESITGNPYAAVWLFAQEEKQSQQQGAGQWQQDSDGDVIIRQVIKHRRE